MALRLATLKATVNLTNGLGPIRWAHIAAMPPPYSDSFHPAAATNAYPPVVLPEFNPNRDRSTSSSSFGFGFPGFSFGGSMELMAVPKKKTSPHKRGIRNGPKALKPAPVIIRCKSCGRVKLPHFYCCSGERGNTSEKNSSDNSIGLSGNEAANISKLQV